MTGDADNVPSACTCTRYVVDYSDPERYHPENVDREDDPRCPIHGSAVECGDGCGCDLTAACPLVSRDADNAPSDRVRAYAEAIQGVRVGNGSFGPQIATKLARAVMAVADREQAELLATISELDASVIEMGEYNQQAETIERQTRWLNNQVDQLNDWMDRAEKAEAEVERLREESNQVAIARNSAMRQRDEERRAKEGNIVALNAAIVRAEKAEAKVARVEALIRKDHTPEEAIHQDHGGQDIVHYCGGCGVDLDEEDCPYLAALRGPEPAEGDAARGPQS